MPLKRLRRVVGSARVARRFVVSLAEEAMSSPLSGPVVFKDCEGVFKAAHPAEAAAGLGAAEAD